MGIASDFLKFIFAVIGYWQAYVTGGILTALITIYERKREKPLSWRSYRWVVVGFVVVAVFLAWRDQLKIAETLAGENNQLIGRIQELEKPPSRSQTETQSLKQRTLRLSNRIREFSEGQSKSWNSKPFNSYPNDPQANAQLNIGRLDFNRKTAEYFRRTFDKELGELIIEFQNDGAAVSVASTLRAHITAPVLAEDKNAENPRWMLADEMVGALKELAGQIDESGKLIH
jgi:hypothetical protein